jgi:hypothetical protein
MRPGLAMLSIVAAAALLGEGMKGMYSSVSYGSAGIDIKQINKARRLSRRNKSVNRSRKKR